LRRSHKEKFNKTLNKMTNIINLDKIIKVILLDASY